MECLSPASELRRVITNEARTMAEGLSFSVRPETLRSLPNQPEHHEIISQVSYQELQDFTSILYDLDFNDQWIRTFIDQVLDEKIALEQDNIALPADNFDFESLPPEPIFINPNDLQAAQLYTCHDPFALKLIEGVPVEERKQFHQALIETNRRNRDLEKLRTFAVFVVSLIEKTAQDPESTSYFQSLHAQTIGAMVDIFAREGNIPAAVKTLQEISPSHRHLFEITFLSKMIPDYDPRVTYPLEHYVRIKIQHIQKKIHAQSRKGSTEEIHELIQLANIVSKNPCYKSLFHTIIWGDETFEGLTSLSKKRLSEEEKFLFGGQILEMTARIGDQKKAHELYLAKNAKHLTSFQEDYLTSCYARGLAPNDLKQAEELLTRIENKKIRLETAFRCYKEASRFCLPHWKSYIDLLEKMKRKQSFQHYYSTLLQKKHCRMVTIVRLRPCLTTQ